MTQNSAKRSKNIYKNMEGVTKMKKNLLVILSVLMIVSLVGCDSPSVDPPKETPSTPTSAEFKFPEKDITIIVPFSAGGGNDILARVIAKVAMDNKYFKGNNIIVENRPGGGGAVGHAYVANTAPKDGYTLFTYTASVVTNSILKDVPYNVTDFKVINGCNTDPVVLVARPDAPYNDVKGLVEYAKTNKLIINDSGFGTSSHMRSLDFTGKLEEQTGIKFNYESIHVDSGSMQIAELMGGHADLAAITVGECSAAILDGSIKALGIMTKNRFEGLPDVPTFAEQGYVGFIDGADRAIACSADVPDDVYNYLVEEFDKLCGSAEYIKAMKDVNLTPANQTPEEYQEFIEAKTALVTSLKDYLLAGEDK
jgi:putative tricarboxylic transport membrane protein